MNRYPAHPFVLLLFLLLNSGLFAQFKKIDSLFTCLQHPARDTNRMVVLNKLSDLVRSKDPQQALDYASQALAKYLFIAAKNKDITDSITYASRIQRSVLPDEEIQRGSVRDYFIFNKPRDTVSGDFFWLAKKGSRVYIAVADCTGDGVPGALVSVIGINMLNNAIELPGIPSPSELLGHLHESCTRRCIKEKPGGKRRTEWILPCSASTGRKRKPGFPGLRDRCIIPSTGNLK
jgi:hypothetical protein